MAYVKQNWKNLPDQTTPVSAARLNHLETQYDEAKSYTDYQIAGVETPVVDLVRDLKYPVSISHRGNRFIYPEHSLEAYVATYEQGMTPEADVRMLADGTLVCIHDATTNRTMTGTGVNVADMTLAQWRSRSVLPPVNGILKGSGLGTPVLFDDYLDMFGGRVVLWPEIKDYSATPAVIKAIKDRGLEKSVVLSSFDWASVRQVADAGIYVTKAGTPDVSPAEYVARGMYGAVFNATAVDATTISNFKNAGLKVITYTLNTPSAVAAEFARGVDGIYSDDVRGTSPYTTPESSIDLSRDFLIMGARAENQLPEQANPFVKNGRLVLSGTAAASRATVKIGAFGKGAATGSLKFKATGQLGVRGSDAASWVAGAYLGYQGNGDVPVTEDGTHACRLVLIRASGQVSVFRVPTPGATAESANAQLLASPIVQSDGRSKTYSFEIRWNADSVEVWEHYSGSYVTIPSAGIAGSNHYVTLANNRMTTAFEDISFSR